MIVLYHVILYYYNIYIYISTLEYKGHPSGPQAGEHPRRGLPVRARGWRGRGARREDRGLRALEGQSYDYYWLYFLFNNSYEYSDY